MPSHVETVEAVEHRFLLLDVTADTFQGVRQALAQVPALRLNYHQGNLEFVTTSPLTTVDPQSLLLHEVDWPSYTALLEALASHHLRITYDRGDLELMTPPARVGSVRADERDGGRRHGDAGAALLDSETSR